MNKLIATALVAFGLLISTAHAEDKSKGWYIYNNYKKPGARNAINDNDQVKHTISVVGMGSCKFSIKIHPSGKANRIPKHCVPECAFPVKVCGNYDNNKKQKCATVETPDSYIIEGGDKNLAVLKNIKPYLRKHCDK